MKKLLLVALLMLALVITAVACNNEPADTTGETTATQTPATAEPDVSTATPETPTEAPEVPTPAPEVPTQAPEVHTEAPEVPTEAPEVPTEAPEIPTEPVTEAPVDPTAPVQMFDHLDVGNVISPGKDMQNGTVEFIDDYAHIIPGGRDPYWYPFSCVDGARFVAIRYRTADATGASMQFFMGSTGDRPTDDSSMLQQALIIDGEWHLAIFDTQSLIDAGIYDGEYVSYFRFDPLECGYVLDENGQPFKDDEGRWVKYELPTGCSIDVAYIGFFNSAEDAEKYDAEKYPVSVDPSKVTTIDPRNLPEGSITGHMPVIVNAENKPDHFPMIAAAGLTDGAMLHQGSIYLGEFDLTKYEKVIIYYATDWGQGTQDGLAAAKEQGFGYIGLSAWDNNNVVNPDRSGFIGEQYNPAGGWVITAHELPNVAASGYSGPVYVSADFLGGQFIIIDRIEFIAK